MAAVLLAVLAAALVVGTRWVLNRGALRAEAEARLSATLGQPVTIGDLRFALLPRAALVGSDIRIGDARQDAPAVDLQRVHIVPRLRSLLRRAIVIEEVLLDGLSLSVLRDREGGWHVPAAIPSPTADQAGTIAIEQVRVENGRVRVLVEAADGRLREASAVDDVRADIGMDADGLRVFPLTARVGGTEVAGETRVDRATIAIELTAGAIADDDLPLLLGLAGQAHPTPLRLPEPASASVSLIIDRTAARLSGTGRIRAPQIALEPLRLERIEAPFRITGQSVVFDPTAFELYQGSSTGTLAIDWSARPVRWAIDTRVNGLDLGGLLNALTGGDSRLDGAGVVTAAVSGRFGEPLARTVNGRAHVAIAGGVVRHFPLLAFINRSLGLAESDTRDTRFERVSATLALGGGGAMTEDLDLVAGHIRAELAGRIGFDRALALSGRAVISPVRSEAAIRSIRELAALRNERGELVLPLTISGTLDNPSFSLDLRAAVGKALTDELRRRLRGIIRPP